MNAAATVVRIKVDAKQTPPEEYPYAGMAEFYENQDRINAEMLGEASELEKWAALQKQKNAPVDSATASYIAMAAAVEAGKFSKEAYDKAQDEAEASTVIDTGFEFGAM